MALLFAYSGISDEQKEKVLREARILGEDAVSQCSFFPNCVQVVLNDSQMSCEGRQKFLDRTIEILRASRWGTDLPIPNLRRINPPEAYQMYSFKIPYDPSLR